MNRLAKTLKALSDPSRLKILKMLQRRGMCVCEITALLRLAQPTVSRHLKTLEEAGLVEGSKRGLWVEYRLSPAEDSPYAAPLLDRLRGWLEDDPEIQALDRLIPQVSRDNLCSARPENGALAPAHDRSRDGQGSEAGRPGTGRGPERTT